jgi:hypothetical protein
MLVSACAWVKWRLLIGGVPALLFMWVVLAA